MNGSITHPEAEHLAAFVDGTLSPAELPGIVEHLGTCEECRSIVGDAAAFTDEERIRPAQRRHINQWLTALAASAVVAVVSVAVYRETHPPLLSLLVSATPRDHRDLEPRLTGGFPWAPVRPITRGEPEANDPARLKVMGAAGEVIGREDDSPAARHAKGVANLLLGRPEDAVRLLRTSSPLEQDAKTLSDLAAAEYVSGTHGRARDLPDALAHADAALRSNPDLPEAMFNRALILESLGQHSAARAQWEAYLRVDSASGWAGEARQHLARLAPRAGFRDELLRRYDEIGRGGSRPFLDERYQEVRTWGESEILARWAEALQAGRAGEANRHLAVARAMGSYCTATRHDGLLADAVAAIDSATPERRLLIAEACSTYRAGRIAYSRQSATAGEPLLRRAAAELERGGSPLALVARYYAANTAFDQNDIGRARSELTALRATLPASYRSLRAEVDWELALCAAAETEWGRALDALQSSARTFRELGESQNEAFVRGLVSDAEQRLGMMDESWADRVEALTRLNGEQSVRSAALLGGATATAIREKNWTAARSLERLELDELRTIDAKPLLVDALIRGALIAMRLDDHAAALRDLSEARSVSSTLANAPARQRAGADLAAAAALVEPRGRAAAEISRAIDFHREHGRRMFLPALLLARARVLRQGGDVAAAMRDLDAGMQQVEESRHTIAAAADRSRFFDFEDDLFAEAIDVRLAAGDATGAFAVAERERGRALLDVVQKLDRPAGSLSIPGGYTVVEYSFVGQRLIAFVVDSNGVTAIEAAPADAARQAIAALRSLSRKDASTLDGDLARLYDLLIRPVADRLRVSNTLVIIPDEELDAVPFAALRDVTRKEFLVERQPIVVCSSAAVFLASLKKKPTEPGDTAAVIIGSPARNGNEPPLAAAADEAAAVARLYRRPVELTGPAATRAAFIAAAERADVVHVAAHGTASASRPSSLLLSTSDGSDGILDASEIAALRLPRAPVVVLAACSTAAGRSLGREGSDSVARGFLAAGARSVIATLAPIEDAAAERAFVLVHRYLREGLDPAAAVRMMQLEALHAREDTRAWAFIETIGS